MLEVGHKVNGGEDPGGDTHACQQEPEVPVLIDEAEGEEERKKRHQHVRSGHQEVLGSKRKRAPNLICVDGREISQRTVTEFKYGCHDVTEPKEH